VRIRAGGFVGAYAKELGGAPRKGLDVYPTPPEVTRALVAAYPPPEGVLWEPACGAGHMARVLVQEGYTVRATDLRQTGYGQGGVDYLREPIPAEVVGIITNPPFALAAQFVEKATAECGYVAMLLKGTFWHASRRKALYRARPPSVVLPLTWRPAFLAAERGNSPMMDVTWTVWDDRLGPAQRYELLDRPPRELALEPELAPALVTLAEALARVLAQLEDRMGGL
jgi:hypothetical protein